MRNTKFVCGAQLWLKHLMLFNHESIEKGQVDLKFTIFAVAEQ